MHVLLAALLPLVLQEPTGSVTGRVVEARSGAALLGVLVRIQSTGQETLTGADGRFVLPAVPAGRQTLVVSVVGYGLAFRDVTVAGGGAIDVTLRLAEGASGYVESTVVASALDATAEPGVASRRVLGSHDLLALRGVLADDPFRAVHVMPTVATGDDFQAVFAVRGQGPRHIGIAVDGIDSPLLLHTVRGIDDTGSLALINSDILESAALQSGAYPQRLGSHLGARLDFTTREPARDRLAARLLLSATAATTVWEGPLRTGTHGGWMVAARRSYIDWLLRAIDPGIEGTFGFTDLQTKISLTPSPRHAIQASLIGGRALLREDDSRPRVNSLERGQNGTIVGNLRWQFTPGSRVALTSQAYVVSSRYRNRVPDGRVRDEGHDRDVTWRATAQVSLGNAGSARQDSASRPGGLLEFGAQTRQVRAARARRRFTTDAQTVLLDARGAYANQAAWISYRYVPRASVTVSPGIRAEHFALVDRVAASPWLLAEWRATPATTFRFDVGMAHQAPPFEQSLLPAPTTPAGAVRRGPEEAVTTDLGVERRLGNAWRATATGYYRHDSDGLRVDTNDFRMADGRLVGPSAAIWANTVAGDAHGVEVSLDRRAANGLSGWIGYAYGHARLRDTRTGEAYDADYDQRHMVNAYAAFRTSGRLSVSARLRYGSNFPINGYFQKIDGTYYSFDRKNRERLPVYARLDLRAERTFTYRRSRMTMFVETLNALNRRNAAQGAFGINFNTLVVSDLLEAGFPLLPSAGFLLEF
jgi:hypothetical protein